MISAVIVAGGSGARLPGDRPKQFRELGGVPILAWSVCSFAGHVEVDEVVVVLPAALAATPPAWLADRASVVSGGDTRAASVGQGIQAVSGAAEAVLVHDGVRPFVTAELISRVVAGARSGPTIPAVPVADTIKEIDDHGRVLRTPDRSGLRAAQTPQGFPAGLLRKLHEATASGADLTDDGVACERAGVDVRTVEGDPLNLKITGPTDLAYARWLVESGMTRAPTL